MRLPGILFAARAKAGAFYTVTKGVMHRAEKIVCGNRLRNPVLVQPSQTCVGEHWVALNSGASDAFRAVPVVRAVYSHALISAQITHGRKRVAGIRVAVAVKKRKDVARFDQGVVLRARLSDKIRVCFLHRWIIGRVLHISVRLRNARSPLRIYLGVFSLPLEGDVVVPGVLFSDSDNSWVWPGCPFDSRRTFKRRKASARIPSSSVSGLFGSSSIYFVLSEGFFRPDRLVFGGVNDLVG